MVENLRRAKENGEFIDDLRNGDGGIIKDQIPQISKKTTSLSVPVSVPAPPFPPSDGRGDCWLVNDSFHVSFVLPKEVRKDEVAADKDDPSTVSRPAKRARTSFTLDQLQVLPTTPYCDLLIKLLMVTECNFPKQMLASA